MARKILFVITHLELGGAQKQLFSLINNLDRDRYDIFLCCSDTGYLKNEFIQLLPNKIKFIKSLRRKINPFWDFVAFLNLFCFMVKNKFDIVHVHSPKASVLGRLAAKLARVKNIIYTVHGWPFHNFMPKTLYNLYLILEKLFARITDKIIVVSSADLEIGLLKKIASKDKLQLIHYGINVEKYNNIFEERKEIFTGNSIVTVSCLKKQKSLNDFLFAAKEISVKYPKIKFFILGDGPLRKKIEKNITDMGIEGKVFLKGWVNDIAYYLKEAKLFVLTSLWEGLPVALIEAIIAGCPAVVTDTKGLSDIANKDNSIIVEPKDNKKMITAICGIVDNYDFWKSKIFKSREGFDLNYWSEKRRIGQLEKIYEDILCDSSL